METLKNTSIAQIKPIPRLYISDRFAARSAPLLKSLNIKYILSLTNLADVPKFDEGEREGFVMKHVEINDDPTEDLLVHLAEACDWIGEKLEEGKDGKSGVLVHCTQGISRSGAVVVGYLMRTLSLTYTTALSLARDSRTLISPNPGFDVQLRVWEQCEFEIFTDSEGKHEKPAYKALKERRDTLLGKGEVAVNKERFRAMAGMAAAFGRRRVDDEEKEGGEGVEGKKSEAWENVERMEEEWKKRLMGGEGVPWKGDDGKEKIEKEKTTK